MTFFQFLIEFVDPLFWFDELLAQISQLVTHQPVVIIAHPSLTLDFSQFFLQITNHITLGSLYAIRLTQRNVGAKEI